MTCIEAVWSECNLDVVIHLRLLTYQDTMQLIAVYCEYVFLYKNRILIMIFVWWSQQKICEKRVMICNKSPRSDWK